MDSPRGHARTPRTLLGPPGHPVLSGGEKQDHGKEKQHGEDGRDGLGRGLEMDVHDGHLVWEFRAASLTVGPAYYLTVTVT